MKKNFTLVAGFLLALTLQAQRPATANGRGEAKATKVEKAEARRAAQRSLYARCFGRMYRLHVGTARWLRE